MVIEYNISKLEAAANESIDRMLEFFSSQNVSLTYRPTCKYVTTPTTSFASVKGNIESYINTVDILTQYHGIESYKEEYGLIVSHEAIAEQSNILKRMIQHNFKSDSDTQDITLHTSLFKVYENTNKLDSIIAHEIWHLIEQERGVKSLHPLIREGTARYVGNQILQIPCNKEISQCDNRISLLYDGAANIIEKHMNNYEHPFERLLEIPFRDEVQNDFLEQYKRIYLKQESKSSETQKNAKKVLLTFEPFKKLEHNLSKENLLIAMRDTGFVKLANEVETQDLTKYLDEMKRIGF